MEQLLDANPSPNPNPLTLTKAIMEQLLEANPNPHPNTKKPRRSWSSFSKLTLTLTLTLTKAIMEQLLEGAYLSSEDHVAALLLVHPERHGHIFVAQCTEAAASYSARLTANAQWSPSSRKLSDPNSSP